MNIKNLLSFDNGIVFYDYNDIIYRADVHALIHEHFQELYNKMEKKARNYAAMMLHGVDDEYWFIIWYLKTAKFDLVIGVK